MKTLVIISHPDFENSKVNKPLISFIEQSNIDIHYLIEPDKNYNISEEQKKLEQYDKIIFQFPLYWYSVPFNMKKWIDFIFTEEWSFGINATALKGKSIAFATTVGSPKESFSPDSYNHYTLEEYLRPIIQMAKLSKMIVDPEIFAIFSTPHITYEDITKYQKQYLDFVKKLIPYK